MNVTPASLHVFSTAVVLKFNSIFDTNSRLLLCNKLEVENLVTVAENKLCQEDTMSNETSPCIVSTAFNFQLITVI